MFRLSKLPDMYRRLIFILAIVISIFLVGTLGYFLINENYTVLDALYMTTITLATVGFHEVGVEHGTLFRIFTILLIIIGISTIGYAVSSITSLIVEGHLRYTFRDRKMEKTLSKMKNHIILCGHGRLGSQAAKALDYTKHPYVIIENDPEAAEKLKEQNIKCLHGNAIEDEVLIAAGVEHASGLIAALAEDTDNLFVTLTARRLNKDLEIVSRANYESSESKLIAAGANKVLLPTKIAGRRMAFMLVQPGVASFLDVVVDTEDMDLSLQEISIPSGSKLDGVSINDAQVPHQIRIIGLKTTDGKMMVNPPSTQSLNAGQKMVVLGENAEIEKYRSNLL